MSTTEAPFSFTTKFGGDLLTIRGESVDQFAERLMELAADPRIAEALGEVQSINGVAAAVRGLNATVVATASPVVEAAAPGQPEVQMDQYGGKWTYGLTDAPDLPDGRGKYVFREWTDKGGKARRAWWDPAYQYAPKKGFPSGATEAKPIWK